MISLNAQIRQHRWTHEKDHHDRDAVHRAVRGQCESAIKPLTLVDPAYHGVQMVGPQLYLSSESPRYQTGLIANMVVLCLMFVIVIFQMFYLTFLNKRNAKRRIAAGKTGRHVDYSLENSSKWAKMKSDAAASAALEESGKGHVVNEHAFEDLTDLKNEDFIYSL